MLKKEQKIKEKRLFFSRFSCLFSFVILGLLNGSVNFAVLIMVLAENFYVLKPVRFGIMEHKRNACNIGRALAGDTVLFCVFGFEEWANYVRLPVSVCWHFSPSFWITVSFVPACPLCSAGRGMFHRRILRTLKHSSFRRSLGISHICSLAAAASDRYTLRYSSGCCE